MVKNERSLIAEIGSRATEQSKLKADAYMASLRSDKKRLEAQRLSLAKLLDEQKDRLAQLDDEIIEADSIAQDIKERITTTTKWLRDLEKAATFQVAVTVQLQKDVDKLSNDLDFADRSKLALEKEIQRLNGEVNYKTNRLKTLDNEIRDRSKILVDTHGQLKKAQDKLSTTVKQDKAYRKGLAEEKIRLASQADSLATTQAALDQDINIRKQMQPNFQLKPVDGPKHFKL